MGTQELRQQVLQLLHALRSPFDFFSSSQWQWQAAQQPGGHLTIGDWMGQARFTSALEAKRFFF